MTFDAFIAKYSGKPLDYDKKFGYQCVDLMRGYIKEVLGFDGYTLPPVKYAKQIYTNFESYKNFTKVQNNPVNVPQKGDIVFWGIYPFITGIAGHVAIFKEGNVNNFISFDQNWPTGTLCHLQKHSYRGVLGWLTLKK